MSIQLLVASEQVSKLAWPAYVHIVKVTARALDVYQIFFNEVKRHAMFMILAKLLYIGNHSWKKSFMGHLLSNVCKKKISAIYFLP